jgi:hypothetical protein
MLEKYRCGAFLLLRLGVSKIHLEVGDFLFFLACCEGAQVAFLLLLVRFVSWFVGDRLFRGMVIFGLWVRMG